MIRHRALVVAGLGVLLASACEQSASGPRGTGGLAGTGGAGGTPDAAAGASGGAASGGGGTAGAGSGGATATTRGTGGATSGGTTAGTGGAGSGGVSGTRLGTGGSGTGGLAGTGGTSGGSGGASDAARGDAEADVADAVLRDALGERVGTGGAGGARSDGPPGTGGSGDAGGSQKIKVWLAGDSTMMSCTGTCPCGWGSELGALLNSNASVVNSAVGGRSIQTWLYDPNVTTTMGSNGECVVNPKTYSSRWQAMLDPGTGMKPGDYLLVEFGINDGDSTCNRHVGTALFQSYLGTMAQAAKQAGAQPIFLTSTSYIGCSGATATTNRGFVSETKAAGQANGVPVIDLTTLSAALYTSLGLCPNNADYTSTTSAVGKLFCEDHTHFEAAGAAQVAKVVAKALKDQGIGLATYLR